MPANWPHLHCLGCGAPMSEASTLRAWPRAHRCGCGLIYADELLDQADPAEWKRIADRDGYSVVRHGDTLEVTVLAHAAATTFDNETHGYR